jgi:hypothetical protein
MYKEVIVTLYEKDYHYGAGALANSLVKSGFKGLFLVGYKGELPPWVSQMTVISTGEFKLSDDITIKFEHLDINMHFGYFKPNFLLYVFQNYPDVKKVYYFDPDIVIISPWSFYSSWVKSGVALCLDNSFPFVYHNHPWRTEWRNLALIDNINSSYNYLNHYINSGFVGVMVRDIVLLERWISLTQRYKESGGDISRFEKDGHRSYKGDQDLLNAAITVSPEIKLSIIGAEGMGFNYPVYLMAHAVEGAKPWNARFINQIIFQGTKPSVAAKAFFNNCNYPILIYPKGKLFAKKLNIKIASALSRIIG